MNLQDILVSGSEVDLRSLNAGNPLTNDVQQRLLNLGFLDPPVDGIFGPVSTLALHEFAQEVGVQMEPSITASLARALLESDIDTLLPVDIKKNLASRIFQYMQLKGHWFARHPGYLNIVYVEGINADGSLNDDRPNGFNDQRMVLTIEDGSPVIVGKWEGTTEPGRKFTLNPVNPLGAARIAFGQYKAWRVGTHFGMTGKNAHEALVQVGGIRVHRDLNKDFERTGDAEFTGSSFHINQHSGFDRPTNDIGPASAGCLVGRKHADHKEFMKLVKTDKRFKNASQGYKFMTTVIAGDDLVKKVP